jgi:hypothetical protein
MGIYQKQSASRLGRSIVTSMATAQVASATNFTTPFAANTHQVRVASTLSLWDHDWLDCRHHREFLRSIHSEQRARILHCHVGASLELPHDIDIDRVCHRYGDGVMTGDEVRCALCDEP